MAGTPKYPKQNLIKMTIEQFAEQNGFVKLTSKNHPKDGQTVEILGRSISKDFNVEKVQCHLMAKITLTRG